MKDSRTVENRRILANAVDAVRLLANRRKRARITQADIAEGIGRSRKWVSEFERGRNAAVALSDVIAYSNALGHSVAILETSGEPLSGETLSDIRSDGARETFVDSEENGGMDAEDG
ncbi:helix-turn-helix transcriptional regulator [Roseibium sp. RKSG952]|uniref:helix-turn-helix domain-containing protein n=1 Tax=Roseibium sp. RKSG952 TaxID=2529384 RepID=UPI0012BC06FE|nr:helix-turn-helix transcriptional regulator [Roseibium sp. RKSG952]MTH95346.1 XRE family transcriptional regulator [Roseibium sp. RKSG952]